MNFDIHYFDVVESTMDLARDKAIEGASEGYVVQGGSQNGGRGRRGNQWASPHGNLYQSIILRPQTQRQFWGQLSFVVAVALGQACLDIGFSKDDVQLKWPNDVLIKGDKLGGILIEAHDDFLILGTGVNVEHAQEGRSKTRNVSPRARDEIRDIFLAKIDLYYNEWQTNGFESIRKEWMAQAYKLGETIQARLPTQIYEGVFDGIDTDGVLLLSSGDEIRKISSADIINWRE